MVPRYTGSRVSDAFICLCCAEGSWSSVCDGSSTSCTRAWCHPLTCMSQRLLCLRPPSGTSDSEIHALSGPSAWKTPLLRSIAHADSKDNTTHTFDSTVGNEKRFCSVLCPTKNFRTQKVAWKWKREAFAAFKRVNELCIHWLRLRHIDFI